MAPLRLLTLGFGAGAFGACVLSLVAYLLARVGVPEMLGIALPQRPMPAALYQTIVWGGLWGLLLVLPVMNRLWWLKGIIIGVVATAVLALYFTPSLREGPPVLLLYILALSAVWGIAAGFWWLAVSGPRKSERRYGTFMR